MTKNSRKYAKENLPPLDLENIRKEVKIIQKEEILRKNNVW